MSTAVSIYLACVSLVGLAVLLRAWLWLRGSHLARRLRLERRPNIDPINTHSPVQDPGQLATTLGLESIRRQFTVHQLLLIPSILMLMLLAGTVPFLGSMPGTFVSLVAAAVTVTLGVAARPFIENAIAGLIIAFSRQVNIGDTVSLDSHYGTVEDITATHTTIKIWDWRRYVVPNARMLNANLINYSLNDTFLWVSVEFCVAHDADIDQVREIALSAPKTSPSYRDYEEPRFWVMKLEREHIQCWVVAWADNPPEGWLLGNDTRTELVRQFRAAGIRTHTYRLDLQGQPVATGTTVVPEDSSRAG